jgi:hypothetical protein
VYSSFSFELRERSRFHMKVGQLDGEGGREVTNGKGELTKKTKLLDGVLSF